MRQPPLTETTCLQKQDYSQKHTTESDKPLCECPLVQLEQLQACAVHELEVGQHQLADVRVVGDDGVPAPLSHTANLHCNGM